MQLNYGPSIKSSSMHDASLLHRLHRSAVRCAVAVLAVASIAAALPTGANAAGWGTAGPVDATFSICQVVGTSKTLYVAVPTVYSADRTPDSGNDRTVLTLVETWCALPFVESDNWTSCCCLDRRQLWEERVTRPSSGAASWISSRPGARSRMSRVISSSAIRRSTRGDVRKRSTEGSSRV